MKYYYKIFVDEGVDESLKSIKASDNFIKELNESSNFKGELEQDMKDFYVGYDVEKIRKGKSAWTWASHKYHYSTNWTFKGEVHPSRNAKVSKLKKLWESE